MISWTSAHLLAEGAFAERNEVPDNQLELGQVLCSVGLRVGPGLARFGKAAFQVLQNARDDNFIACHHTACILLMHDDMPNEV